MKKRLLKKQQKRFWLPKLHEVNPVETEESFKIEQINPSPMTFHFRLNDADCHQKLTGMCSLDRSPATGTQHGGEAGLHYCQNLYSQIEQYGFRLPVQIMKCRCGHYDFHDGQHRVCIAKKKRLELPAIVDTEESCDCGYCVPRWELQYDELR